MITRAPLASNPGPGPRVRRVPRRWRRGGPVRPGTRRL